MRRIVLMFLLLVSASSLTSSLAAENSRFHKDWETDLIFYARTAPKFACCSDGTTYIAGDGMLTTVDPTGRVADTRPGMEGYLLGLACGSDGNLHGLLTDHDGGKLAITPRAAIHKVTVTELGIEVGHALAVAAGRPGGAWVASANLPRLGGVTLFRSDELGRLVQKVRTNSRAEGDQMGLVGTSDGVTLMDKLRYEFAEFTDRGRTALQRRDDAEFNGAPVFSSGPPGSKVQNVGALIEGRLIVEVVKRWPVAGTPMMTVGENWYFEVLNAAGRPVAGPLSLEGLGHLAGTDGSRNMYFYRTFAPNRVVLARATLPRLVVGP